MNFSEQLQKFIVSQSEHTEFKRNGYAVDKMAENNFLCGAYTLKPIVLKLHNAVQYLPCDYIELVGAHVNKMEHATKCFKCKILAEVSHMLEGGGV